MRLSIFEIKIILKHSKYIFGEYSKTYLFGSRLSDNLKGGDIDLYIKPEIINNLHLQKIEFLTLVEKDLGEQKIDVIFEKDKNRAIELMAIKNGVELNIDEVRLKKYISECDKHLQRMEEAFDDMKNILPLNSQKYLTLEKDIVQDIDQYIFRFSKLQDTLGDKIFKLILKKYEDENYVMPFIDLLNKLEKYELIASSKEWIYLRRLRNEISHQYDDEPEEMSQAINNFISQKDVIKNIFINIKNKVLI